MLKYRTAYLCGYAKLPSSLPTTVSNASLTLGLEIDLESGIILRVGVTLLTELGREMVKSYFLNKHVIDDYDQIVEEITLRHQGTAAKPIIKAYSDIRRNFIDYMKANEAALTM